MSYSFLLTYKLADIHLIPINKYMLIFQYVFYNIKKKNGKNKQVHSVTSVKDILIQHGIFVEDKKQNKR